MQDGHRKVKWGRDNNFTTIYFSFKCLHLIEDMTGSIRTIVVMDPLISLFDPSADELEMLPESLPPEVCFCLTYCFQYLLNGKKHSCICVNGGTQLGCLGACVQMNL